MATGDRQQADGVYLAPDCSDFPASEPPIWARASKVTGMVISADCVAALGSGASTVSVPSGDREEDTRVGSTPGGSLDRAEKQDKGYRSLLPREPLALLPVSAFPHPFKQETRTHVYFRVKHREM